MKRLVLLPLLSLALLASCSSSEQKLATGKYYHVIDELGETSIVVLDESKSFSTNEIRSYVGYRYRDVGVTIIDKRTIKQYLFEDLGSDTFHFSLTYEYNYECISNEIYSIESGNLTGRFKDGLIRFESRGLYVTEAYAKKNNYKIIKL